MSDEKLFQRLLADTSDTDSTLPDGTVLSAAESAAARLEVGEMRRQVERMRRDHATDPEATIGQAKDLIETVCRTILGLTGDTTGSEPLTLHALVKLAQICPARIDVGRVAVPTPRPSRSSDTAVAQPQHRPSVSDC